MIVGRNDKLETKLTSLHKLQNLEEYKDESNSEGNLDQPEVSEDWGGCKKG